MSPLLLTFFWDPKPELFTIPFIHHPVLWYSVFFAVGYLIAYWAVQKQITTFLGQKVSLDRLAMYLFIGMLVGARLGHVFFYESWSHYAHSPLRIFYTWEGGLASHGAGIGILIALALYWKFHKIQAMPFLRLLDFLCIGICFAASCIRIGNFFNQEILGIETQGWTAVWFGHPADANATMPCHPVQLYEALFYMAVGTTLFFTNRAIPSLREGILAGIFFLSVFSFRFCIEWIKLPQAVSDDGTGLLMGQLLSLPFILLGLFLVFYRGRRGRHAT